MIPILDWTLVDQIIFYHQIFSVIRLTWYITVFTITLLKIKHLIFFMFVILLAGSDLNASLKLVPDKFYMWAIQN